MNRCMKVSVVVLTAAAALLFGSACYAQISTPFVASGSSGAFNAIALGGVSVPGPSTGTIGIKSIAGNGTTATVTCGSTKGAAPCGVRVNDVVRISGDSVPGLDCTAGCAVLSVPSQSTFTYSNSTTGNGINGSVTDNVTPTVPVCTNLPNASPLSAATNVWTWTQSGSGSGAFIQGADSRGASNANGTAWVEWNGDQLGTTTTSVCVYLNIDSIVGNRLFFGTASSGLPAGSIFINGSCSAPPATDHLLDGTGIFPPESALPSSVCGAISGLPFNAAPSDIRAEDAKFGTERACGDSTLLPASLPFNYGPCTVGQSILTGMKSGKSAQVVGFNIAGNDPICSPTCVPIAHSTGGVDGVPYVSLNVAGQVLLAIVNTQDTSASGLGATGFSNIDRRTLARVFEGKITRTCDLIETSACTAAGTKPLAVLVREPLSGTFNTFEFEIPRNAENGASQESQENVLTTTAPGGQECTIEAGSQTGEVACATPPAGWSLGTGTSNNPLDIQQTFGGTKTSLGLKIRVIGTGEMVNTVGCPGDGKACADINGFEGTLTNQIGYTFFSFGNVKPAVGFAKYLLVDGVDPLYDGPAGPTQNPGGTGAFPVLNVTSPYPTFTNVINGSYPIWNILRVITTGELGATTSTGTCDPAASVCQLVNALQSQFGSIPDLAPLSAMTVFRSHSTINLNGTNFLGSNGNAKGTTETGSDVGGAVLTVQSDLDFYLDTGNKDQETGLKQ